MLAGTNQTIPLTNKTNKHTHKRTNKQKQKKTTNTNTHTHKTNKNKTNTHKKQTNNPEQMSGKFESYQIWNYELFSHVIDVLRFFYIISFPI